MTTPIPGTTYPIPRTWSAGDNITTPRLRGDLGNIAGFFMGARPILAAANVQNDIPSATRTLVHIGNNVNLNTWNVNVIPNSAATLAYAVPLSGWYLAESWITVEMAGTTQNFAYGCGFQAVINGAGAANQDGGRVCGNNTVGDTVGCGGAELYQLNEATSDTVIPYVYDSNTGAFGIVFLANFSLEWVALPTSGLSNYGGPYGTVNANPRNAVPWPPGEGTTLVGSIAAGATSLVVASNIGIITGGTLGLDIVNGQQYSPVAENVTVTSVVGTTIGISATSYAHASAAPVAVPVSAAFLNQQLSGAVKFLAYPPMLRAAPGSTQSIPSTAGFPTVGGNPTNQVGLLVSGLDNFSGFSSNAYTAPVGGLYYVYAQLALAGVNLTNYSYGVGISVNGGTIQWGTVATSDSTSTAQSVIPVFRRHLRLNGGDVLTMWAFQSSGGAMSTAFSSPTFTKLIVIWRAQ